MSYDRIVIENLQLPVTIGTFPEERLHPQTLSFEITLTCDTTTAARTDALEDAVDYFSFAEGVSQLITQSHFHLIESLAGAIADFALAQRGVLGILLRIRKPNVIPHADAAVLQITRGKYD